MNTELLHAPADLARAATLLMQGELVAVPTETVYGLAADASNPDAVTKIFEAKQRPANHPLIVHLASAEHLSSWAKDIPERAWQLAAAFWPGPLTMLLAKADAVNSVVTGGKDTIGLRVPAHPALLQLLQQHQLAVAAPSANPHKKLSPTSAEQVLAGLDGKIAAVLDGGDCDVGLESTIVDLTSETVQVLRAGPISCEEISLVLGCEVSMPREHNVAVPGNVKAHYQPSKPLTILNSAELASRLRQRPADVICLYISDVFDAMALPHWQKLPTDKVAYAKQLYRSLFDADKAEGREIWLEQPPQLPNWADVNDRLKRAQHRG